MQGVERKGQRRTLRNSSCKQHYITDNNGLKEFRAGKIKRPVASARLAGDKLGAGLRTQLDTRSPWNAAVVPNSVDWTIWRIVSTLMWLTSFCSIR